MVGANPKRSRARLRQRNAVSVLACLAVLGLTALGHALAPGEAAPELSAPAHRARGLTVIGVSVDDERENAQQFVSKVKVTFPIVHDAKHTVASRFKPPRMPTSYVLDRQGKVRFVHEGYRADDARAIEREIESLLR